MILVAAFLIADLQIFGGDNDTFEAALAEIPEEQISESTTEENTPGSSSWYNNIDKFRIPQHWAVYSNGIPVVAGSSVSNREPVIVHMPDRGKLDLVVRTADGFDHDYHAEQFFVRWGGFYHAIATNYTELICADTYGKPLMWMKGHKLDKDLYGAYFSSYNAYFERLYFGGMKEGSFFEGEEWFVPQMETQFVRNGPAPDYHRLREYPIITNFMEHVARMSSNLKADLMPNDMSAVDDHPSFYNSSGGILDNSLSSESEKMAHVYWASTFKPPLIKQNVSFETNEVLRIPDDSELGKLLPEFDWREDAIATRDNKGKLVESQFWQCYAITLDALFDESGEFTENPIKHLFLDVGVEESAGPLDFVRGYCKCGKYNFLTNLFPYAAMSSPNAYVSIEDYKKCFGEYARSRKVLPGAFVGANHILGVMNRTIYVPAINIAVEHNVEEVERYALLTCDEELEIKLTYDESSRRWKLDDPLEDITFTATKDFATDNWNTLDPVTLPYIQLHVSPVAVGLHESSDSAESFGTVILLTQGRVNRIFEESGARDYIDIEGASGEIDMLGNPAIRLSYRTDTEPYISRDAYIGVGGTTGLFKFSPRVMATGTYDVIDPGYASENPAENHVPSSLTTDRVSVNKIAFLDRRDIGTGYYDATTEYRSEGESTVTAWNTDHYGVHERSLFEELDDIFSEKTDRDWRRSEEMIRIPDSVTFKFSADNSFVDDEGDIKTTLQTTYNHEEPTYICDLHLENYYGFDQSNVVDTTHWSCETNWWETFVWYEPTEEGWVLSWCETNLVNGAGEYDYKTTVVTNNMTEPALAETGYRDDTVYVPFIRLNDDMYDYDIGYRTNFITGSVEYWIYDFYDTYTNNVCHIDPEEGDIWDDPTVDERYRQEVYKDDWRTERETYDGNEHRTLTGQEVVNAATNVEETVEVTPCNLYHRVYRDGRVEAWYYHPYTGEMTVVSEGQLPIPIGEYAATLIPDVNNTYTTDDIDAFTDGFDCKIRYSAIESADFRWNSMNAQ